MRVGVLSKTGFGLEGPHSLSGDDPVEACIVCNSLEEALYEQWDFDAHVALYEVPGEAQWPRINKIGLPWLYEQGARVVTSYIGIDVDFSDHSLTWPSGNCDAAISELYEEMQAAMDAVPALSKWAFIYPTRGGCRVMYHMESPLDVEEAEDHIRWVAQQWIVNGFSGSGKFKVDFLQDWTRLFRLPAVDRDGTKTAEESYFNIIEQKESLEWDSLGKLTNEASKIAKVRRESLRVDNTDMPEPEDCHAMLWLTAETGNRSNMTEWHKAAKKRLRGRECYPYLFENAQLTEDRDMTLTSLAGQACSLLFTLETCTPQRIYALFYELTATLEPDSGTPDWFRSVWGKIVRFYSQELAAKEVEVKAKEAEKASVAQDIGTSLVNGAREWCSEKIIYNSVPVALRWLGRRMIANCGSAYFLMSKNGKYENLPLKEKQIIPRIRVSEVSAFIPTSKETDDGQKDLSVTNIINKHVTIIRDVVGVCGGSEGGSIDNIDQANAVLRLNLYRLNPNLSPLFNEDVDMWLQMLFGEDYALGCEWIGHALAFDEGPIAALSLHGDAGAGKKMLVQGLAECLETPAVAQSEDLVGEWGYSLLKSPFLSVNEGWPKQSRFSKDPLDSFRKVVGGDGVSACRKSEAPIEVKVPMRVIFTANNQDVVRMLGVGRTLTLEDRNSIEDRLIHLKIGNRASKWLQKKGGRAFTGSPGNRWIESDSGHKSDFIVARHFLYLYAHRKAPAAGNRFLVQGCRGQEIMAEIKLESGETPVVIETVLDMIDRYNPDAAKGTKRPEHMKGIHIEVDTQRVFVTTGGIQKAYRGKEGLIQARRRDLEQREITKALSSIALALASYPFSPGKGAAKARWHELDIEVLMQAALKNGWSCDTLSSLYSDKKLNEHEAQKAIAARREEATA